MNFYDKAHELMRAFKESEEYKTYMAAKEKVKQNDILTDGLREFKEKQRQQQLQYISGKEMTEENVKEMQQLYSVLAQNEDVVKFFEAEIRLDVMLTDMQKIINETLKDVVEL